MVIIFSWNLLDLKLLSVIGSICRWICDWNWIESLLILFFLIIVQGDLTVGIQILG